MQNKNFYGYNIIETIRTSKRFVICKASDKEGKTVVLKIAGTGFFINNPRAVEKAFRAAEAMWEITRKYEPTGLVHISEVVKTDKTFFIVMEYVEGVSLEEALPNMSISRNQSDLDEIEEQLTALVRDIHDYGYAPAAIEASNVMITPDDRVVLLNYLNPYVQDDDISYLNTVDEFMDECYRSISHYDDTGAASYPMPDYESRPRSLIKPEIIALSAMAAVSSILILFLFLINNRTAEPDYAGKGSVIEEELVIEAPSATLFLFEEDGLYGFKNSLGKTVIYPEYDYAEPFRDGKAKVMKNHKGYIIDKDGEILREFQPGGYRY